MESERVILKRLREINGLTIRQAAEQVGRSIGWLSEIETGSRKCALKVRDREKLMQLYKADKYKRQFGSWLTNAQKETNKQKAPSLDGAIYKYLRTEKAKMTLKKVALRLGVSLGYLSKIESNQRTPKKEMKEKMLKLYGYSVNSFRNFSVRYPWYLVEVHHHTNHHIFNKYIVFRFQLLEMT